MAARDYPDDLFLQVCGIVMGIHGGVDGEVVGPSSLAPVAVASLAHRASCRHTTTSIGLRR